MAPQNDLLAASREALAKSLPTVLEANERTYFLRFSIVVGFVEIFDTPAPNYPLIQGFFDCLPTTPDGALLSQNRTYRITPLPLKSPR